MTVVDLTKAPRGIRNNNPGNIEYNPANKWKGLNPKTKELDSRFCVFTEPEWGIRALMILIRNYQRKYGLKTVQQIIHRWAPSHENNTSAYVTHVARIMGVKPDESVDLENRDNLIKIAQAITVHENGVQPYSKYYYQSAYLYIDRVPDTDAVIEQIRHNYETA